MFFGDDYYICFLEDFDEMYSTYKETGEYPYNSLADYMEELEGADETDSE